jgi:RNA exonuclease 4
MQQPSVFSPCEEYFGEQVGDTAASKRRRVFLGDCFTGALALHERLPKWQTLTGGRMWMCLVKSRRNRHGATKRPSSTAPVAAVGEQNRGAVRDSQVPHPGVQAAKFKEDLRKSLKKLRSQIVEDSNAQKLRSQIADDSDAQLSEASTVSVEGSSADEPAVEEIWDAVTNKASLSDDSSICSSVDSEHNGVKPRRKESPLRSGCVAIDCEMVGVGKNRSRSILARVAIVDEYGTCLFDSYVRPTEPITDYRTRWSGIRASDLVGAPSFDTVRQRVVQLIRGRILIGHAIHNDLNVLNITHPPALIRDTAFYPGSPQSLVIFSKKPKTD